MLKPIHSNIADVDISPLYYKQWNSLWILFQTFDTDELVGQRKVSVSDHLASYFTLHSLEYSYKKQFMRDKKTIKSFIMV